METLHIVFVGGKTPQKDSLPLATDKLFRGKEISEIIYHYVGLDYSKTHGILNSVHHVVHNKFERTAFYTIREKNIAYDEDLRLLKYSQGTPIIYLHMYTVQNDSLYSSYYDFMLSINPTKYVENVGFYLGMLKNIETIIDICSDIPYHPLCGASLMGQPAHVLEEVIPILLQGAHLLHGYHEHDFFLSKDHLVSREKSWVYSSANIFTKALIDGYNLNPPFEGDYSSKTMINDTEYRKTIAEYTLQFFIFFCRNNGVKLSMLKDKNPTDVARVAVCFLKHFLNSVSIE